MAELWFSYLVSLIIICYSTPLLFIFCFSFIIITPLWHDCELNKISGKLDNIDVCRYFNWKQEHVAYITRALRMPVLSTLILICSFELCVWGKCGIKPSQGISHHLAQLSSDLASLSYNLTGLWLESFCDLTLTLLDLLHELTWLKRSGWFEVSHLNV